MNPIRSAITLSVLALCAGLTACTPQVPKTAEELKASLTEVGTTTQNIVERAPDVADSARDTLEQVGEKTLAATAATREGLEKVGNTVLSITESAPSNEPAPVQR